MSFSASFSASQPSGEPSVITLTDTSTGSDASISVRHVYLRKSDGTFLVPTDTTTDYIVWDYADAGIDIDCLDKDYALLITVEWLNVGEVVLHDSSSYNAFTSYNEDFDYTLTTMLSANRLLTNDNTFRQNKFDLRTYIDSGDKALARYSDIANAQICYDAATSVRLGSQYYFNESTG